LKWSAVNASLPKYLSVAIKQNRKLGMIFHFQKKLTEKKHKINLKTNLHNGLTYSTSESKKQRPVNENNLVNFRRNKN
jgi:hypothetical protein